jgi:tRNA (guanine-N7-)-methyltransferase
MRDGAELRIATDDRGYLVWMLEHLLADRRFLWTAQRPAECSARPSDWPETRYEAKAKKAGKTCTYLRFLRV